MRRNVVRLLFMWKLVMLIKELKMPDGRSKTPKITSCDTHLRTLEYSGCVKCNSNHVSPEQLFKLPSEVVSDQYWEE